LCQSIATLQRILLHDKKLNDNTVETQLSRSRIIIRQRRKKMNSDDDTLNNINDIRIIENGVIYENITRCATNDMNNNHHDIDNASLNGNNSAPSTNTYIVNILSSYSSKDEVIDTLRYHMHTRESLKSFESSLSSSNLNTFHSMIASGCDSGLYHVKDQVLYLPAISEAEMLICIGSRASIHEFPCWLLRLVEIQYMSDIHDMNAEIYCYLLENYSKTIQRGGT